jgi:hypothetical protein
MCAVGRDEASLVHRELRTSDEAIANTSVEDRQRINEFPPIHDFSAAYEIPPQSLPALFESLFRNTQKVDSDVSTNRFRDE